MFVTDTGNIDQLFAGSGVIHHPSLMGRIYYPATVRMTNLPPFSLLIAENGGKTRIHVAVTIDPETLSKKRKDPKSVEVNTNTMDIMMSDDDTASAQ